MIDMNRRVLPGFRLGLILTLSYLTIIVIIPMAAGFQQAAALSRSEFLHAVWTPQAIAAYKLTFGASFIAACVNLVIGTIVAWTLVRYDFPLKRLLDAMVDIPFALPTAVAGLVYASLLVPEGWYGKFLVPMGIHGAYSRLGIIIVLVFTGFPFVVRTVQPVLQDLDAEVEEAAAVLGASRNQTFWRVIFPMLVPPTLTGFTLAFARSIGEYGSVIFISSNMPFETEIAPMLIVARLEEYSYREASAIAISLLCLSLILLIAVNRLERWSKRHEQA